MGHKSVDNARNESAVVEASNNNPLDVVKDEPTVGHSIPISRSADHRHPDDRDGLRILQFEATSKEMGVMYPVPLRSVSVYNVNMRRRPSPLADFSVT